jgi:transposase
VYGFARPATGETVTVLLPRVSVERMADALAAFAAHADPEGGKVLILVVDNTGWHTAKRLAVPANVRLHYLPPCTPELQPVEPFWALVREAVTNDAFDRLADLRRRITRRCLRLAVDRAMVRGAIGFRWAVNLEAQAVNARRYEMLSRFG